MAKTSLLISASDDASSDDFERRHGASVVRINADSIGDLGVTFSHDGFECQGLSDDCLESVYWRKPFIPSAKADDPQKHFEREQRRYVLKSLCLLAKLKGAWLLVDPDYESAAPRPVQLLVAGRHFRVPRWQIAAGGRIDLNRDRVVKSLVPVPVDGKHFLSTQRIPPETTLAPDYTWYVQDCVDATHDVTVVYCCGRLWAFELSRGQLGDQVDWRLFGDNHRPTSWQPTQIPMSDASAIPRFMGALGLHFGRLDFLRDTKGNLWFLEVNPNGQFGWLETGGSLGMHDWIFDCALKRPAANSLSFRV